MYCHVFEVCFLCCVVGAMLISVADLLLPHVLSLCVERF